MATPIIPPEKKGTLRESYKWLVADANQRKRSREMAERATRSFREFMPLAWSTVEPAKSYLANWSMDAQAEHAQAVADGQIKKLLVVVPPGSSKSIIWAVQFPAWMWAPGRNPGWRSTFASYSSDLSTRDSVRCRDLLQSVWYQETFRPDWRFATDQNVKTFFVNSAKGHRFSTSVGATATGFRGDAIICDDSLKASDRNSDAALTAVVDWWDNEMFNRLNSLQDGAKVVIMQRLSDRDLAGHILREGGYEVLLIPMEYEPARSRVTCIGWQDPRTEAGELMFPALFPRDVVDDLKKNAATYRAQYQQDPSGAGGSVLKPHLWNYWQPAGLNLAPVRVKMPDNSIEERRAVPLPDAFDVELMSWDCTFKDAKESDYVVGLGTKVRGAQRFVFDHCRDRMDLPATISAVRAMAGRMPAAHLKLIEDKANGPAVIQMLQKELTGLVAVNPQGGKVARAASASVELEAGNWYLPHPMMAPWVGNPESPTDSGFLAETVLFPFGANDDQVDAWSQTAIHLQELQVGGEFGVSEKDIRIDPLEIPEKWPRLFGVSINWRELGAVWITRAPDTNQHYLYASFVAGGNDPATYAAEMKKQGDWIPGVMHAAAPGRDEKSGHALISTYQKLGVHLEGVPDDVAAELADMAKALRAGELKILSNVPAVFDQFRMFHRDDKGKLPDVNCGTIMAMCVAWRSRSRMRVKPEPSKPRQTNYSANGPQNSWMGS